MKMFSRFAVLLLLLIALMGVCFAAEAAVEEVTINVTAVDSVTGEALDRTFYLAHAQCVAEHAVGQACTCFDHAHIGAAHWALVGLTPCDCGEEWDRFQATRNGTSLTFKTGHKYVLYPYYNAFGYGEYYVRPRPGAYLYADPETGAISFIGNGMKLTQTGSHSLLLTMENRMAPVDVRINATKLMDGEDPGQRQFAFALWQLTEEQMVEYFDMEQILGLLDEDEFPAFNEEDLEGLTDEEALNTVLTSEYRKLILQRLRARLDQLDHEIVYSDGKQVPILNKTFTAYDFELSSESTAIGKNFFYVIAEMPVSGNGICEDPSIYALEVGIGGRYPTLPSNLEDDADFSHLDPLFDMATPLKYSLGGFMGISVDAGFLLPEFEIDEAYLNRAMVFRNTTCPYADPGPTATPEPAPDVPATADGGFPIYWAALLLVGVMAMILRPRKA